MQQGVFMDIKVEDKGGLERNISVTIPAADVATKLEEQYASLAKTIKIDGFRVGKVPVKVVKERHGEQVRSETSQKFVQESLAKAIEDNEFQVAGQPHVHAHDIKEGEDYAFSAHFEVYPTFEPKGLEKLKLVKETAEPTDKMMDKLIKDLMKQMQDFKEKKGAAKEGDRVTMNATGYVTKDGKEEAFEGGDLKDFPVVIGSNSLIPGFEDGLVGLKKGDAKDLKVKFPKTYHSEELKGKPAIFKLTVLKIEEPAESELNDEFAKKLGLENAEKVKAALKEGAQRDLDGASMQRLKRAMFDQLDEKNTFDIPKGLVEHEFQTLWNQTLRDLYMRGMTVEQLGKPEEEAKDELREVASRRVRLGLLLAEVAKSQDIKVEAEDIKGAVEAEIQKAGPRAQEVKDYFAKQENLQQLVGPLLEEKVVTWLLDKNKVDEKKIDPEELIKELTS